LSLSFSHPGRPVPHSGSSRIDYQGDLNPAQFEAVSLTAGPVLVIAGAGSGKTRTLVYRLAYLVEHGIAPWNILLLTFTRKASQEMLHRASQLIDRPLQQVAGGTFHAVCHGWLRRYGSRLGYNSGFTLLDRHDQGDLVRTLQDRLEIKASPGQFPRRGTLVEIFGALVNKDLDLETLMAREYPQFINQAPTIFTLNDLYRQHKREHYLLDYDDLLLEGRRLLTEHDDLRLELSQRCQYIMVDEYQDTNRLQSELVKLLAFTHDNVMAVGDDSQSIYSFRGANFRNIMDFPRLFPGTRIIKLEENYRSTQPILDLTNTIIAEASEKYTKCLFTQKKEGPKPVLLQAGSENEQSRLICETVAELQNQGISLHNIAVLFRSAYHSFDLELELQGRHIPFMKFGGFKFMESAHIKDLLAHLRVAANPRDSVSWNRLLQLVPGIGKKSAQKFLAQLKQGEFSLATALQWLTSQKSAKARAGLESLADLLQELQNPDLGPATRLGLALAYYEPILQTHFDDYPKRQKDFKSLVEITERYRKLDDFLNDLTLEPPNSMAEIAAEPGEYLTLSTIHSAKGLEWDAVFIIWAAEGRFPSTYSQEKEEELEEERRLMYVAATRARHYLYITYPAVSYTRYLGTTFNTVSRFVRDLPQSLLESMKVEPAW
jgi:DNA helicase-2/ATP-dependent DNA helicase PcrA